MVRNRCALLFVALAALWLVGCEDIRKSPGEIVSERAKARWDALIRGDLQTAYDYLSPGYRQSTPFGRYRRKIRGVGLWRKARVERVECDEAEVCKVLVMVDVHLVIPRSGGEPIESTNPVYERWIYSEGQWWYVPDR